VPESGYDRRINLSADSCFNGSFRLSGGTNNRRLDPHLRPSGIFDSLLDLSRQLPPFLFTRRREARSLTVAGTNGESQKDSRP
jgi:hypothetical protein